MHPVRTQIMRILAGTIVVIATLAACSDGEEDVDAPVSSYVALGDSGAAGAGISDTASPGCGRSKRNYPSLVAEQLGVGAFVDVTCPGATTQDVLSGQKLPNGFTSRPQIDAISADTELVTVTIGGNDEKYSPTLFLSCYVPSRYEETRCARALAVLPYVVGTVRANVAALLEEVQTRAPDALVLLVTYPRIVPESGQCPGLGLPDSLLPQAARAEQELDEAIRAAASDTGVDVVDMRTLSSGHDACASRDTAWVNAMDVEPGDGTYLHPRAQGAQAMADAVHAAVVGALDPN